MMNISAQMRDNPLPLLLISTGVGLMISRGWRDTGYHGGMGMYRDDEHGDMMRRSSDPTAGYGNNRDEYRGSSSSGGMMSSMREGISSQAASLQETMSETYSSATERMSDMSERAGEYTRRARSGLSTLATEQPLVLGALGLLAGAALAAMLPRTQMEEEYVGSAARQLRDQASGMASETLERAKSAASRAAEVAQEEFSSGGESDKASGGPSAQGTSNDTGENSGVFGYQAGKGGARPSETIASGQGSSGGST